MNRPKLLDLYCGEGGAAMGYYRAGFAVYGLDINARPRYPFAFRQDDAIAVLRVLLRGDKVAFSDGVNVEWLKLDEFAAVHASPPCQAYSITRHSHNVEHPDLLPITRELILETGLPYIIENVPGAPLNNPTTLCGSMFDITAEDIDGTPLALRRHRLFESNREIAAPGGCRHTDMIVGGVYGGGRHRRTNERDAKRRGGYTPIKSVRAELMGMPWATMNGLSQAIPPKYTYHLGMQLMKQVAL